MHVRICIPSLNNTLMSKAAPTAMYNQIKIADLQYAVHWQLAWVGID